MKILGLICLLIFQLCFAEDLLKINQSIDNSQAQIYRNPYDVRAVVQTNSKLDYFLPVLKKCIEYENKETQLLSKEIEALNKIDIPEFAIQEKENRNKLLHQHQVKKSFCEFIVLKINRLQNQLFESNQKMYESHLFAKHDNIFKAFSQFDEPIYRKAPFNSGFTQFIRKSNAGTYLKFLFMIFFAVFFLKILDLTKFINIPLIKKISIIQYTKMFLIFLVLSLVQYILLKIIYAHHNELMLSIFDKPVLKPIMLGLCIYLYLFYKNCSFKKDFLLIFAHIFLMAYLIGACFEVNFLLIKNFSNQEILVKKYLILIVLQPVLYSVVYWSFCKIFIINFYFKFIPGLFFIFTNIIFVLGLMGYEDLAVNIDFIIIINSICITLLFTTHFLKKTFFSIFDEQQTTRQYLDRFLQNRSKLAIINIKIIGQIIYISSMAFLIYCIVYLSFWFIPEEFFQNLLEFFYAERNIGIYYFTIPKIPQSMVLFCILNLINFTTSQYIATKVVQEEISRQKITNLFHWLGYALSFLIVLKFIGFNLQDFMIIFGGLSLGIGLGLKNLLSSLISSVILFINPSFKKGDYIEIGEAKGYVKDISLLETTIETSDNNIIILPNQYVASSVIQNFTYENKSFQKVHLYYTINDFKIDEEENIKIKIFEELRKNSHLVESTHQPINLFFSLLEQATDIYRLEIVFSLKDKINIKEEMSKINRKIYEKLKRMHLDVHYENMQYPHM